jgi:hypothetical protein
MFTARYFAPVYFAPVYFAEVGATPSFLAMWALGSNVTVGLTIEPK